MWQKSQEQRKNSKDILRNYNSYCKVFLFLIYKWWLEMKKKKKKTRDRVEKWARDRYRQFTKKAKQTGSQVHIWETTLRHHFLLMILAEIQVFDHSFFYYLKIMEITYSTSINGTFHNWSLSSDVQRGLKCIVSWESKPHKCTSDGSYFLHNKREK